MVGSAWILWQSAQAYATPGRLGGGGGVDISIGRVLAVTVLCVMLAALAALIMKRGGGGLRVGSLGNLLRRLPTDRRVQVVETRRASQFADVCLIRCDDREYLALCSQHQFLLLRDAPLTNAVFTQDSQPCE